MELTGAFDGADDYEQLEFGELKLLGELKLRETALRDLNVLKKKLQAQVQKQNTPRKTLLRDKLSFTVGTVLAILAAFWLGHSPAKFYQIYTGAALVLFTTRWCLYYSKGWHNYMYDFCYIANVLYLLHLWVYPHSSAWHKIMFSYATGPLAWSIIAFRNSLVFHSLDKSTSLFLHWFPACVAWTERWHPDIHIREYNRKSPAAMQAFSQKGSEWHKASLLELVLLPQVPYLAWTVFYYAKIFIISSEKIKKRGYQTLYNYITSNDSNPAAKFVASVPKPWQPLAYMGLHIFLTTATFAVSKLMWDHYYVHTGFLLAVLCISSWNASNFYFGRRFASRFFEGLGGLNHMDTSGAVSNPGSDLGSPRTTMQGSGGSQPDLTRPLPHVNSDPHKDSDNGQANPP